jgi:uncharacterized protein
VKDVFDWVLFFVMCSFAGWTMETIVVSVKAKKFINRGFLYGCFCPIYGCGAILIILLSDWLDGLKNGDAWEIIVFAFVATLMITFLVYITSWFLEVVFNRRWWDFSNHYANLDGRICLVFSILWGFLAPVLTEFIDPLAEQVIIRIPSPLASIAVLLLVAYLITDTVLSVRNELDKRGPFLFSKQDIAELDEYEICVQDLLEDDEVFNMWNFTHHHQPSCLHHSIRVSYISYKICRWLHLDYRSAARGGLLHDFFLHDSNGFPSHNGIHVLSSPLSILLKAERRFGLNQMEKEIVMKRLNPISRNRPRYKETYIVLLVVKYCTVKEYFGNGRRILRQSHFRQFSK